MEIFSSQAGRVTAIDGDITPLLLEVGDDHVDDEPNSNWGGYGEFRAIITGFGVQQQGGFQFLHTLRDFIYVYVFGERIGQMSIEGIAFNANCEAGPDAIIEQASGKIGPQYHGLEWVQAYYLDNRITERPDPITIVLGLDTPFYGFLTSLKFEVVDSPDKPFLGHFAMGFHVIPDFSDLVDDVGDDFDADEVLGAQLAFAQQLQTQALLGQQPGPGNQGVIFGSQQVRTGTNGQGGTVGGNGGGNGNNGNQGNGNNGNQGNNQGFIQ